MQNDGVDTFSFPREKVDAIEVHHIKSGLYALLTDIDRAFTTNGDGTYTLNAVETLEVLAHAQVRLFAYVHQFGFPYLFPLAFKLILEQANNPKHDHSTIHTIFSELAGQTLLDFEHARTLYFPDDNEDLEVDPFDMPEEDNVEPVFSDED